MKKNVTDILDIHTHKQEVDTQGKSIINYPLLADSPLYMPLAENVEVAVGRGSYYSIGIHPWEVRESNVSQQLSFLQQQLQRKQFVAVGEAGLGKFAKAPQQPWIWHGFRGKPEQAVQLLKKGFYLSFGEYYPDETMQIVPDERLFLETDDSLLDIEDILCQAARVRGVEVEALCEVIRRNIQNVFFKA